MKTMVLFLQEYTTQQIQLDVFLANNGLQFEFEHQHDWFFGLYEKFQYLILLFLIAFLSSGEMAFSADSISDFETFRS